MKDPLPPDAKGRLFPFHGVFLSLFLHQLLRCLQGRIQCVTNSKECYVITFFFHIGFADRNFIISFGNATFVELLADIVNALTFEENYRVETRFLHIWACHGEKYIKDTDAFGNAAIFPNRHEAARAVQWHRQECGDRGQLYDIRPI